IETKLVTDKEGLHTLQTSVQFNGESVRNSYDNCEKANERVSKFIFEQNKPKDDHDESDEIDKFFKSPSETKSSNLFSQKTDNSTKKRRKLSSERSIANEADDEKDKVDEAHGSPTSEEDDNADYIPIPEEEDSDYVASNDEDQNPPPLLTLSQFKCFDESYAKMKKTQKWILSTGTCVEDAIFEHCNKLLSESLHSWIVDLDDQEIEALFTVTELKEIRREVRRLPKVDETFVESLMRFANVKTTSELRHILETTSYRNMDEPYDREKHYDAEWVDIVMRKYLTNYEDPNGILHKSHLESWHDINVWSLIIDHGLQNLIGIETVRSQQVGQYLQEKTERGYVHVTRISNVRRWDPVWMEYLGHITKVRKLRVVGMLHLDLKTQVLHLNSPKGYVSILKREKLLEVPVTVEKIQDLIRVLTSVWMLKKAIMDCVDTVNLQAQNSIDLRQELVAMGTETPPPSIVLPWSCDIL
ncbi:3215_t:CDS:10, partial [Ambispora leptoticha]